MLKVDYLLKGHTVKGRYHANLFRQLRQSVKAYAHVRQENAHVNNSVVMAAMHDGALFFRPYMLTAHSAKGILCMHLGVMCTPTFSKSWIRLRTDRYTQSIQIKKTKHSPSICTLMF